LRSLRAEGGGSAAIPAHAEEAGSVAAPSNLASELGAARGYYAARIAAARQRLSGAALVAAIRAIESEKTIVIRAIIERWQAYFQNVRKQRRRGPEWPSPSLLHHPMLRNG
jgi:hypothetical protein